MVCSLQCNPARTACEIHRHWEQSRHFSHFVANSLLNGTSCSVPRRSVSIVDGLARMKAWMLNMIRFRRSTQTCVFLTLSRKTQVEKLANNFTFKFRRCTYYWNFTAFFDVPKVTFWSTLKKPSKQQLFTIAAKNPQSGFSLWMLSCIRYAHAHIHTQTYRHKHAHTLMQIIIARLILCAHFLAKTKSL